MVVAANGASANRATAAVSTAGSGTRVPRLGKSIIPSTERLVGQRVVDPWAKHEQTLVALGESAWTVDRRVLIAGTAQGKRIQGQFTPHLKPPLKKLIQVSAHAKLNEFPASLRTTPCSCLAVWLFPDWSPCRHRSLNTLINKELRQCEVAGYSSAPSGPTRSWC